MKVDYHPHITLAETRNIIQSVRKLFSYDLSVYSLANLQHLLSDYIYSKGILLPDILISRMTDYPDAFNDLLHWLEVPDSEMFRNPEVWTLLQKEIIPALLKNGDVPKIWFPSCSSCEELFSLAILAIEGRFRDQIKLLATSSSTLRIKEAERGLFKGNSLDISKENYLHSGGKIKLEHYIERIDTVIVRKMEVRENIEFARQGNIPEKRANAVDLIVFKNRLIYYTPEAQIRVLENLIDSIKPGGYLLLGYKEAIKDEDLLARVRLVYEEEKIYQVI
jgi:chemotaxis protein methyltransferase CheR